MNFYPNIEDEVFYNLAEKYVSKDKLIKKNKNYYYTLSNYNYLLDHTFSDCILLFKKVRHTSSKKEYKNNIKDLISIFKKKYGNMKRKNGKNIVTSWKTAHWESEIWETFTFRNKHKVIIIEGIQSNNLTDYQKSDKENQQCLNNYDNYKIFIEFYTLKSFRDKKNKIKKYEKFIQKQKIDESIEKEKKQKELMNDI